MFDQVTPIQKILELKRTGSQPIFTSSMLYVVACAIIYSSCPIFLIFVQIPQTLFSFSQNSSTNDGIMKFSKVPPKKHGDFVETVDLHVTGVGQYRRRVVNRTWREVGSDFKDRSSNFRGNNRLLLFQIPEKSPDRIAVENAHLVVTSLDASNELLEKHPHGQDKLW
jgi:hypothetical protein